MKFKKDLIKLAVSFAALVVSSIVPPNALNIFSKSKEPETPVIFYENMANNLDTIQVYEPDELTADTLEHRNGKIIIEKIIGEVTNKETGDGKILNTDNKKYNYINYSGVENISDGTVILTYCIYNPDSNEPDDIIARYNYILDTENED